MGLLATAKFCVLPQILQQTVFEKLYFQTELGRRVSVLTVDDVAATLILLAFTRVDASECSIIETKVLESEKARHNAFHQTSLLGIEASKWLRSIRLGA